MKLDAFKLGVATAVVSAVVWVICSILVVLIPTAMMRVSGGMLHANLASQSWSLHWAGFFIGLILWTALPALFVWATAAVYNRLVD
jgi:hypothetical protein